MNDDPQPQAPAGRMRRLFLGKDGLRAGWSLLLFAGMMALGLTAFHFGFKHLIPRTPHAPGVPAPEVAWKSILSLSCVSALLLGSTRLLARLEGRPLGAYGFGGPAKGRLALRGAFWGFACLSLLILLLRATGHLAFDGRLLGGWGALKFAALWLVAFGLVGFVEEYLMRGYLQYTLARGLRGLACALGVPESRARFGGFWIAGLALAFLFGFAHQGNGGETLLGLVSAGLAGFAFCLSLYRTGSLWWALGFHATWDWGQSYFYGTADSGGMSSGRLLGTHPAGNALWSGGTTGPEGSLLMLPILVLIVVLILWTLPRRGPGCP